MTRTITTFSSREFNQDPGRAKKAARKGPVFITDRGHPAHVRSEEHTSELQSQSNLVCRLLLEKKNNHTTLSSSNRQIDDAHSNKVLLDASCAFSTDTNIIARFRLPFSYSLDNDPHPHSNSHDH